MKTQQNAGKKSGLGLARLLVALILTMFAAVSSANRIILIPLDSRPAAGQFAQMIARIGGVDVRMPPYELLGRFVNPGKPDEILDWLEAQDFSDVTAIVASTDMVGYGGLIASREASVTATQAMARIHRMAEIRERAPHTKLYAFSSTMRLAPTATRQNRDWRALLTRYEELAQIVAAGDLKFEAEKTRIEAKVPADEIARYESTRVRNHLVQRELIRMAALKMWDYLVIGQDDARAHGPHVPETLALRRIVDGLYVGGRVYFCEGIDQHANILLSRALLKAGEWTPRVRIVYSDELGQYKYANYESKTIAKSLEDQILASGARPMVKNGNYDYSLYVNTPGRRAATFTAFQESLKSELEQGFPVAVADINLAKDGNADPLLFATLWDHARLMKLLSFAGWNTAGNTLGTAIPAANAYLLARRTNVDPLVREVAQREFLLHRFVDDVAYHRYTRPAAYEIIDSGGVGTHEEIYGAEWETVNNFVQRDLNKYLTRYFTDQFLGRRFFAGPAEYAFTGLSDVKIWLPWPRPYEVRLDFRLQVQPVPLSSPEPPSHVG